MNNLNTSKPYSELYYEYINYSNDELLVFIGDSFDNEEKLNSAPKVNHDMIKVALERGII